MKLFALFRGDYEQRHLVAVFSTKELAIKYEIEAFREPGSDIDECDLDPDAGVKP
jgi:hypothetical protein